MKKKASNFFAYRKLIHNESVSGYVFALPFIAGFLGFTILPMLFSFYLSFTSYRIGAQSIWTGFDNYIRMFTNDPMFGNSIKVTIYYVIASVPLKIIFALFVAMLLTRTKILSGFYRSIYYLPSLIGGSVAVSLVWKELFASRGVINSLFAMLGIEETVFWLGDPNLAIWTLILLSVWQFGSSMIIFAAGIKQIPISYYEAARIDGSSFLQQTLYITLPCLSPVILFNTVMQTIGAFMSFTQAFIITNGGPMDSTMFYALYLYNRAFNYHEMGYASALAWILLLMVGFVTMLIFKTSDQFVYYESKGGR